MGQSVGKIIIIILSFRVDTSKNKNIGHGVKETCAIMSTQVTYKISHIQTRFNNIKCTNFLFFLYFYHILKEKAHIKRNINSKKRNVYVGNQYYYYLGLLKIRFGGTSTTKN